jgi:threonine aldolase
MKEHGVGIGAFGPKTVRVVTHLDVTSDDIDSALATFSKVLVA